MNAKWQKTFMSSPAQRQSVGETIVALIGFGAGWISDPTEQSDHRDEYRASRLKIAT